MKALDLYCGAGGASKGLSNAGFEVTGIDINEMPEYPFKFIKQDITKLQPSFVNTFDFVWASPPCQNYTWASGHARNKGKKYPDLVVFTRRLLSDSARYSVIENVPQAPIRQDLILCGEMFGLRVLRHRAFEVQGFGIKKPKHPKHKPTIQVDGRKKKKSWYMQVAGHGGQSYSFKLKDWQKAMGIDWMSKKTLVEAIPPAYSEYIAKEFLSSQRRKSVKEESK